MFTNTPSDRVQVIGQGSLQHPGACALCGSGNCDDGYVSTGIYYEYEGFVYFCMNCAKQIAEAIGCLLPDEASHLREISEAVATKCSRLEEKNANLNDRLSAWNNIVAESIASGAVRAPVSEVEPNSNVSNLDVVTGPDDGESESKESGTEPGPNDVKQPPVRNRKFNV